MQTAAYLTNNEPHSGLDIGKPFKKLWGKEENLQHMRVLGARAFAHIEVHTPKPEPNAWEGIRVGHSSNSNGIRIYNPEARNVWFLDTPSRLHASLAATQKTSLSTSTTREATF